MKMPARRQLAGKCCNRLIKISQQSSEYICKPACSGQPAIAHQHLEPASQQDDAGEYQWYPEQRAVGWQYRAGGVAAGFFRPGRPGDIELANGYGSGLQLLRIDITPTYLQLPLDMLGLPGGLMHASASGDLI